MANRWKGNIIAALATNSVGTNFTGKANGSWSLNSQLQQKQSNLWAKGIYNPTTPTGVTASSGDMQGTISFTASSDSGGAGPLTYTVTSTPENRTASAASSPITVTGLTNGTSYTFTVKSINTYGLTSPDSISTNSIIPSQINSMVFLNNSSNTYAYEWNNGFSTKWSMFSGPENFNGYATKAIAVTSDTKTLITAQQGFLGGVKITKIGWGSLISSPTTVLTSGTPYGGLSLGNNVVFVGLDAAPGINAYAWSDTSGFGTKFANPTSTYDSNKIYYNGTNTVAAISYNKSGHKLVVYPWNNGFGTRYADPTTTINSANSAISLSPAGTSILYNTDAAYGHIGGYAWSTANGYGTKFATPTIPNIYNISCFTFHPTGNYLIVGSGYRANDVKAFAYNWTEANNFGSLLASPSITVAYPIDVTISISGDVVLFGSSYEEWVMAYSFNNGFGTKYAAPSGLEAQDISDIAACGF